VRRLEYFLKETLQAFRRNGFVVFAAISTAFIALFLLGGAILVQREVNKIAQSVEAYQASRALSSYFLIEATPRPGHTIEELQKVIDEEIAKLQREGPTAHEVQRAINQTESTFFSRMERVGGYRGKAEQLNAYYTTTGDPDWFNEDLARYRAISPSDVRAAAEVFLPANLRVELTVVPEK